jgi:hypothetical protein
MRTHTLKRLGREPKLTFWFFSVILFPLCVKGFYELFFYIYRTMFVIVTELRMASLINDCIELGSIISSAIVYVILYRTYKKHYYEKRIFKYSWIPFIGMVMFWVVLSRIIDRFNEDLLERFILQFAIPLSFIYIPIRIIIDNKENISGMFRKLALLPLAIIASHVFLMFTTDTFSGSGAWWLLYLLIVLCPVASIVLYAIGVGTGTKK